MRGSESKATVLGCMIKNLKMERKVMTNLDSVFKSRDSILPTKALV